MSEFDPLGILRRLRDEDVRFVVIGGFAGNLRGSADVTQDLDICYARDDDNLEHLAQALRTLNARLRVAIEQDMDLPFQLDAATLRLGDSFTFITDLGDFDILATPSGTNGFDDLEGGATTIVLENIAVRVASLDDLIRMKRASRRTKDLLHIEHLSALREDIAAFERRNVDPQQGS
ncbi:MAG: hypothetical protein WBM72_01710 [Actinomycetota bacterium]